MFSYLQTKVDNDNIPGQFILTGSQQFGLIEGVSQSLAGRVGFLQLLPFSISELYQAHFNLTNVTKLLYQGFYPPIYDTKVTPQQWYSNYVMTYLERDLRKMINVSNLSTFQRFLRLCASRIGQLLNLSGLANDCGISHNTAKSWISVLEASYILFLLQPHHKNFNKRLIKTPKLYFYDTGLAAWLLNIQNDTQLDTHYQKGNLFESFIISEFIKSRFNNGFPHNFYFWRNKSGDEIDLLIDKGNILIPVEIKSGKTINSEFFKTLQKWEIITKKKTSKYSYLIYGGGENIINKNIKVIPWLEIKNRNIAKLFK